MAEFHIWCAMVHWQGFVPVYTTCVSMFMLRRAEAHQSIKHVDVCCIHGETNVTSWHGSRQTHHDDHAHNVAWICTYSSRLECIPILWGQEHLWSREGCSPMWVHHTKCMAIFKQASIYIYIYTHTYHAQCKHTKQESKLDIANILGVWPSKVQEK